MRGERALITGATGGVGHLAVQLARWRGARIVAATSNPDLARELGADEILGEAPDEPVDLAFDTAGGDALTDAIAWVRDGGRVVSVAEEPAGVPDGISSAYFVVGPNREQLVEIARLADDGELRPMIDSVYALDDALAAFDRLEQRGKRGKVVLRIVDEG